MARCAEIVTMEINVEPEEFVPVREVAIREVKERHPGLLEIPLISKRDDGKWTEVWIYESREAAMAAMDDIPNMPKFLAFTELCGPPEVVMTEVLDSGDVTL